MTHIIKFSGHCCNVDNADDLAKMLAIGGVELTSDEIASAGMVGYENIVGPSNTSINTDGSIIFTTPPEAVLSERLYTMLRSARDLRLSDSDKYLLSDYPISEEALAQVKIYRAALRNLTEQPGAPWDGGGELTPWPELPDVG